MKAEACYYCRAPRPSEPLEFMAWIAAAIFDPESERWLWVCHQCESKLTETKDLIEGGRRRS